MEGNCFSYFDCCQTYFCSAAATATATATATAIAIIIITIPKVIVAFSYGFKHFFIKSLNLSFGSKIALLNSKGEYKSNQIKILIFDGRGKPQYSERNISEWSRNSRKSTHIIMTMNSGIEC